MAVKYNVREKNIESDQFYFKTNLGSESLPNHKQYNNNNAKPSVFTLNVEAITYLRFINLQDFTFKTRKQSFDNSFSLCLTVTLIEPI